MTGEGSGVWVYAVTWERSADLLDDALAGLAGVGGKPVRMIRHVGLAAVVETVGLDAFGEEALRRNLEDLDWLATTARAHDAVVAAAARCGATVPVRLATVYRDDERIRMMLATRRTDLGDALHRVSGRTEWGVKAYGDRSVLARPVDTESTANGGAGTAYLLRRRAQLSADREVERRAAAEAERIHTALAGLAVAARRHPPQDPRLSGKREWMLLNGSYLVDDERTAEFREAVAAQDGAIPGIGLELTGPWPPYSFAAALEAGS